MAIRLLVPLFDFPTNTILRDLGYNLEQRIIARGGGTHDLTGGAETSVPTLAADLSGVEIDAILMEQLLFANRNTDTLEEVGAGSGGGISQAELDAATKVQTFHHTTTLEVVPTNEQGYPFGNEFHAENTGGFKIDAATLEEGWSIKIVNTTNQPITITSAGFAGAFARTGGTVRDFRGVPLTLNRNASVVLQVTVNGANKFLNGYVNDLRMNSRYTQKLPQVNLHDDMLISPAWMDGRDTVIYSDLSTTKSGYGTFDIGSEERVAGLARSFCVHITKQDAQARKVLIEVFDKNTPAQKAQGMFALNSNGECTGANSTSTSDFKAKAISFDLGETVLLCLFYANASGVDKDVSLRFYPAYGNYATGLPSMTQHVTATGELSVVWSGQIENFSDVEGAIVEEFKHYIGTAYVGGVIDVTSSFEGFQPFTIKKNHPSSLMVLGTGSLPSDNDLTGTARVSFWMKLNANSNNRTGIRFTSSNGSKWARVNISDGVITTDSGVNVVKNFKCGDWHYFEFETTLTSRAVDTGGTRVDLYVLISTKNSTSNDGSLTGNLTLSALKIDNPFVVY